MRIEAHHARMMAQNKDSLPSKALKAHLRQQRKRARLDPDRAAQLLHMPTRRAARSVSPIGRTVLNIARPLLRGHGAGVNELSMRWPELAGPRLARICTLEKLSRSREGNILCVVARGGAGAALVELESSALIARINAAFGRNFISGLRIRQGRISMAKAQTAVPKPVRGPTPAELGALEKNIQRLPDGPLRDAARKLGLAMLSHSVQSDKLKPHP
jgi:hypothetical protein